MRSVLICSTPIHGHISPLLSVARHLVGRGQRVRFLTGVNYRDAVNATGAIWVPLPAAADFDDKALDTEFPGRAGLVGVPSLRYDLTEIFLRPVPAQIAAVDELLAAEPTDAILAESLFFGAAAFAQRPRAQRPLVLNLGIVPLSLKSVHTAPFGLGIAPLRGLPGRIRNTLMTVLAEKVIFRSVQREAERVFQSATGRPFAGFVMDWPSAVDAIIQFTVAGFEYPRPDRPGLVHFVGPVSRSAGGDGELPAWWPELDAGRPVVHVTQGTVANLDYASLIEPTLAGLAAEDVLVVVSTGGRDPATLTQPLPANVRVARYLPYDQLLPRTHVMVTNGGYGGVHFAMQHGVPLVVAGTTEDKIEVTARVAWSGVGINLKTDTPTPAAIAAAVRSVLTEPSYRRASERIGAEILAAPGLDALADAVELGGTPAR
jgi:UDP:flavonoid glycosyltransferase YjiC (YdhE family)